jgi:hypothetical protein
MRCELCNADLNAPESVLVTVKLATRLNRRDEVILPPDQTVSVEGLDEESVECAECGELLRCMPSTEDQNPEKS